MEAGIAAAAIAAVPALIAPAGGEAATPTQAEALAGALGVEQLAVFCYRHALTSGTLGPVASALANAFLVQEQAHAAALQARAGTLGVAIPPPPADVTEADRALEALHVRDLSTARTQKHLIALLETLEEVSEGTYYVLLGATGEAALLELAAQIMGNEAQHAMWLRALMTPRDVMKIVPSAFAEGRH